MAGWADSADDLGAAARRAGGAGVNLCFAWFQLRTGLDHALKEEFVLGKTIGNLSERFAG
jgi:hypothetical protein